MNPDKDLEKELKAWDTANDKAWDHVNDMSRYVMFGGSRSGKTSYVDGVFKAQWLEAEGKWEILPLTPEQELQRAIGKAVEVMRG